MKAISGRLNQLDPPLSLKLLACETQKGLKVVVFDDIHLCEIMDPPITTVRQPLDLLMNSAVDLLIGRMEGRNTNPPEHVTLTPELIVRGSTARVAAH